jgi:hypothetical protein
LVLLRLADHASPEGDNVRPGIPSVAHATGLSERQVQRYIKEFLQDGVIVVLKDESGGRGRVTTYGFPAVMADQFRGRSTRAKGDTDDTLSNRRKGDTHDPLSIAPKGDADDTLYGEKGDMEGSKRVTTMTLKGDTHDTKGGHG